MTASNGGPKASRPNMPGYGIVAEGEGDGLLPWSFARDRLERARNYLLATVTAGVTPDAAKPHVMPVWGVGIDDTFQFSTGRESRKGKNLALNPHCTVCPEGAEEAIIVEGEVRELDDAAAKARFVEAYKSKYDVDMSTMPSPAYVLAPRCVFALVEATFTTSATRWTFER